jgi:hypothetical protein
MLPNPNPEAFISLTSELSDEGKAVESELQPCFKTFHYLNSGAGSRPPDKVLEEKIASVDIFILIMGRKYGSFVSGDAAVRGWVEWEHDTANTRAKTNELELMPFVPKPPKNAATEKRQSLFIDKVMTTHYCNSYANVLELRMAVRRSLWQWLVEFRRRTIMGRLSMVQIADRIVTAFAIASVTFFVVSCRAAGVTFELSAKITGIVGSCLALLWALRKTL